MRRSPELKGLIADITNPNISNDPPSEIKIDPVVNAVNILHSPVEMRTFLKAYVKGMFKFELAEFIQTEGLTSSITHRRQIRQRATSDAVGYVLTKALDSSPSSWHSDTWFSVAEHSCFWPPKENGGLDKLDDARYDNFGEL